MLNCKLLNIIFDTKNQSLFYREKVNIHKYSTKSIWNKNCSNLSLIVKRPAPCQLGIQRFTDLQPNNFPFTPDSITYLKIIFQKFFASKKCGHYEDGIRNRHNWIGSGWKNRSDSIFLRVNWSGQKLFFFSNVQPPDRIT